MYLVSNTESFAKLFFLISFTGLFTYIILAFYTFHTAYLTVTDVNKVQNKIQDLPDPGMGIRFEKDLKYILLWMLANFTDPNRILEGQQLFIDYNCSYINCFMTSDRELLDGDYVNFDAILLEVPYLRTWPRLQLPIKRSRKQKYIFRGMLSSDDFPVCNAEADDFFNWTWSYKLYSDIFNPFIRVKDWKGNTIAPRMFVEWGTDDDKVREEDLPNTVLEKLRAKSKAVAWVIRKCGTRNNRMIFARELRLALKSLDLSLDIYGCNNLMCPKEDCSHILKKDYYFYLVYEDSLAEDYVTKEVLNAYNNLAVPIVISGADLTRFLPPGSYINGRYSSANKLAEMIDYIINNQKPYYKYHLWRSNYTFHEVEPLQGVCDLCRILNDPKMMSTETKYEYFRKWWYNGPLGERCYPKSAEKFLEVLSYVNGSHL